MKFAFAVLGMAIVFSPAASFAKNEGQLPPGAKPLPKADVSSLFAGKTINFTNGPSYYFAPDGKLAGFRVGRKSFADGDWTVAANQMCMNSVWHDGDKSKTFPYSMCHKFYTAGGKIWVENAKVDEQWMGDKYPFEKGMKPKLVAGDKVSANVTKMKAELGY
jgi:hypothetical protein